MRLSSFLHTDKWFQLLLYNRHNLTSVICLHTVCTIWPIDRTLSGAITLPALQGPLWKNVEVLHIPEISKFGASLLVLCDIQDTSWGRSYSSEEMLSVFSTIAADWADT